MSRPINAIIIHCSGSRDGKPVSREALEAMHKARGFRTIGYHYVIEPNGDLVTGRPESEVGAHVEGHNARSIGVCMIGTERFSVEAWAALRLLVHNLQRRYPQAIVRGHRDYSPDLDGDGKIERNEWTKTCPGFDVATWLANDCMPSQEDILS